MRSHIFGFAFILLSATGLAWDMAEAGEAAVLDASAVANANGTYAITVTLTHADEGWSHYADKWEVLDPTGQVLGTRILYHPHVNEQPFTRSLAQVNVPIGVTEVTIRAFDNVHGAGSRTFTLQLPPRR